MAKKVVVMGGGVAGLTAAHELSERDFDVELYESKDRLGGKSRSMSYGEMDLPAEHGFRFMPGCYSHLPDTMERIPADEGTVSDNLVTASSLRKSMVGQPDRISADEIPRSVKEFRETTQKMVWRGEVPALEHNYFLNRVMTLLTSCEERWENEYEETSWWEFMDADRMSDEYRKFLVRGATKILVAMKPRESSTKTIGKMTIQTMLDILHPERDAVRILNDPTSESFIEPWRRYLDSLGVRIETGTEVTEFNYDPVRNEITGVRLDADGKTWDVEGDYYVSALPLRVLSKLATDEMKNCCSGLAGLDELTTDWMNGIQFYLSENREVTEGHGMYFDSPWALTSVSQRQFWNRDWSQYGEIEGVVSVCISDWDRNGLLHEKPAKRCSPEEIKEEVWYQLKVHLNHEEEVLSDDILVDYHLDPAISYDGERNTNDSPLFVNTLGSWKHRPEADCGIDNFYVAGDYVKTNSDLATMESANESARRAVNALLNDTDVRAERCRIWDLPEPRMFEPLKKLDKARYKLGLPHLGERTGKVWLKASSLGLTDQTEGILS
ncbi:MAG: oleate hydratase [Halobacteria archaeon]